MGHVKRRRVFPTTSPGSHAAFIALPQPQLSYIFLFLLILYRNCIMYINVYIYIHTYTYINTYIHTHTYIWAKSSAKSNQSIPSIRSIDRSSDWQILFNFLNGRQHIVIHSHRGSLLYFLTGNVQIYSHAQVDANNQHKVRKPTATTRFDWRVDTGR